MPRQIKAIDAGVSGQRDRTEGWREALETPLYILTNASPSDESIPRHLSKEKGFSLRAHIVPIADSQSGLGTEEAGKGRHYLLVRS